MFIAIGVFALLAVLSGLGYFVERRIGKTLPVVPTPNLLKVSVVSRTTGGEWAVLGTSVDSFQSLSASPTLQANEFVLCADDGRRFLVPAGSSVSILGIEGARRAPTEGITGKGTVDVRFTFEVKPTQALWVDSTDLQPLPPDDVYRAAPPGDQLANPIQVALLGTPTTRPGTSAIPGCWLFPLVLSLVGILFGQGVVGLIVGGLIVFTLMVLVVALPKAKPSLPAPLD